MFTSQRNISDALTCFVVVESEIMVSHVFTFFLTKFDIILWIFRRNTSIVGIFIWRHCITTWQTKKILKVETENINLIQNQKTTG
jgi:hypothetical protein